MGEYSYQGTISSSAAFEYFPYEVSDLSRDTVEIVNELISGHEEWEIFRELSLLSVEADVLYRPFATLSNGERTEGAACGFVFKRKQFSAD